MVSVRLAMLAALAAIFTIFPLWSGLNPEAGVFVFQNYGPKRYGGSPQNWSVAQDPKGLLYIANNEGILQYDSVSWRKIPITNRSTVRAVAVDATGKVYAGGEGVFGELKPDASGFLQFVSLLDRVPEPDRKFGNVWTILPTPKGAYFLAYRRLFRLGADQKIKTWNPQTTFYQAFYAMGSLFVAERNGMLFRMANDRLVPVPGTEPFAHELLRSALPWGNTTLLVTDKRFYAFDGSSIRPFQTLGDPYFEKNLIYVAHGLANGTILVGTRRGGLVVLSRDGNVDRIIGKEEGLASDYVTALYTDADRGVWVITDNGFNRFEPGLTKFETREGLRGNVFSINRQGGSLLAGTTAGLFRMRTFPGEEPSFEPVGDINRTVYAIQDFGGDSLVGTDVGIFLLHGAKQEYVLKTNLINDIGVSHQDPNVIYAAGRDGLLMIRREGSKWKKIAEEKGSNREFRTAVEAKDGRVWATTQSEVWRVDFRTQPPKSEQFVAAQGIPKGWTNAYLFRGHVVFATEQGLRQFDEPNRRFVPDTELGEQFANGTRAVSVLSEDTAHNVWVSGKGFQGALLSQPDRSYQWVEMPLVRSGIEELYGFHLDPDGTCWASGADGELFRWEGSAADFLKRKVAVLTRKVQVLDQTEAFFGGAIKASSDPLPYNNRALRFEFAAPSFEGEGHVEYQWKLEGSDANWSAWTHETRKDYTNLPESHYTFRVRARNAHNILSQEDDFTFQVLPPWYRTWWAYILWVFLGLVILWGIIQRRLKSLKEQNEKLELIVEERTAEVRMQRDMIQAEERKSEALLVNILPAPVALELKTTGSVAPVAFEDVTVCFTDFVGFTLSSEKLPPTELVSALNEYFTAFDEIVGRYGLEKLKTIGDAYMLVSGLPRRRSSHAVDAVLAAIEMAETVKRLSARHSLPKWKVRIGLHSGPVVAGVVGVRKFAFDIWGDTVNFAARMESSGSAGRVNISAATYSRVKDFIDCEYRGQVRIKEGRELDMYFANSPAEELTGTEGPGQIPLGFRRQYKEVFQCEPASYPAPLLDAAEAVDSTGPQCVA